MQAQPKQLFLKVGDTGRIRYVGPRRSPELVTREVGSLRSQEIQQLGKSGVRGVKKLGNSESREVRQLGRSGVGGVVKLDDSRNQEESRT